VQLVVGRIGRAHGIRGDVAVDVRTDDPERRFAPGATLDTEPPERGPLTVESARWHSGRLLVRFDGCADRSAAESLRGIVLVADSSTSPPPEAPDEWWDHDLVGLAAVATDGATIGEVVEVLHPPGADLLVVRRPDGTEAFVPFVSEIVPEVDVAGGRLVVAPPEGLLDL
jgi:16S rRNA processing protein RimM